jgi:molybdopterin-binding protein
VITELVYQGETAIVMIELGNGKILTSRANTRAGDDVDSLELGQTVSVSIDKNDAIVIPGETK